MYIEYKRNDNKAITLSNGQQFIIESNYITVVEKWAINDTIKVEKLNRDSPYSYKITNESQLNMAMAGKPK